MNRPLVLIIDDDRTIIHMVSRSLSALDIEIISAATATEGLEAVRERSPDTVLLDIKLPDMSGLDVFRETQQIDRRLPVIFVTADSDSSMAIDAMQLGAYDYVMKPLELPSLNELVKQALAMRRRMNVPVAVPNSPQSDQPGDVFVGRSPEMLQVFKTIGRVSRQKVAVLIRGESGTGKELVARAIYQHSDRSQECFMAVNCAALPDTLLESELFGHEKGAFTGADQRRIGKFEQCNGGTIFLDEVGDMSSLVQGKVLRLLQEQRFERVGGNETIETDVRIVAATNRNLEQMVGAGDFREDLFFRLNGVTIDLPPLRDRTGDIPVLLKHFLSLASQEMQRSDVEGISPDALEILTRYAWPGNVRELQSVVRQALMNTSGPIVVPEFLPAEVRGTRPRQKKAEDRGLPDSDLQPFVEGQLSHGSTDLYAEAMEVMERYLFARVLRETAGNQTKAAEILGITRGKVRDRIAAFDISLDKTVNVGGEGHSRESDQDN